MDLLGCDEKLFSFWLAVDVQNIFILVVMSTFWLAVAPFFLLFANKCDECGYYCD